MCVATAASMDGYTAFGASIEKDGLKQTLSCPAPRAVVADLEVLKHAPKEMTASGYADLLGKVTSGADWLIADALEVEKIDPTGWSLVQDHLRGWTDSPAELRAGDQKATERLMEGLILSGLGMQSYQSSRTASGAEHQFSHLWEMEGLGQGEGHKGTPLSHGFKVGGMLQAAGCPTGPIEIGLSWDDFEATYSRARTIRKRYTVLDLAFEAGILEECVDELFAPVGFWGRSVVSQTRADGTRLVGSFRSDVREKHDDR